MKQPWKMEPDSLEFELKGYKCRIKRIPQFGHLSGYVCVSCEDGNPYYGSSIDDLEDKLEVHGGITYSSEEDSNFEWWIGFDCCHVGDRVPSNPEFLMPPSGTYRTYGYVLDELIKLVDQIYETTTKRRAKTDSR